MNTCTRVNIGCKQVDPGYYRDLNPADCKLPSPLVETVIYETTVHKNQFFAHHVAEPVFTHSVEDIPGEFWQQTGAPKQRVASRNNLTGEVRYFSEEKWS
jgi:hypothetical protein